MAATSDRLGGILGTDQYQLAMAQVYWKEGLADRPAQFDYFFRGYPDYGTHQAGYCITSGLGWLLEWMEGVRFEAEDIDLLASQVSATGAPRFDRGFLDWLTRHGNLGSIEMRAVPEGRVVHANAPVAVVRGPLAMTQILETPLLNRLNYPTLVATKAARVDEAARGAAVLEFGMRRGPHSGVHAGGRGALVGGADFTSNVALSHAMGIDPKGTHAHSMVQAFLALGFDEADAFRKFADLYPDECILLVDTIDVLGSGVPNAIRVFEELRAKGHEPAGIRIDSGDLAYMTIQSAILLDDAGFEDVAIVLSSDLDELVIWQILSQLESEAPRYGLDPAHLVGRVTFGVGTRLITSHGDPSLGGVYKLVAIDDDSGRSEPAIKISENVEKMAIPGEKKVLRVYDSRGLATADIIALADEEPMAADVVELFHPHRELHRTLRKEQVSATESLLDLVFADGARLDGEPDLESLRKRRQDDLDRLHPGVRRLVNPHIYHVSLTRGLKDLQAELVRRLSNGDAG
ncbi:MAG TPA: nicotinate phosphoribosyltransferase [Acidimicrobiia bacterium]|jgi:nicotinate phosphoribosyltransferase|nr:nicotinate phosphoribosyltransferase [Acidimicrobiia bacterium]